MVKRNLDFRTFGPCSLLNAEYLFSVDGVGLFATFSTLDLKKWRVTRLLTYATSSGQVADYLALWRHRTGAADRAGGGKGRTSLLPVKVTLFF